jgi:hypothetical protein
MKTILFFILLSLTIPAFAPGNKVTTLFCLEPNNPYNSLFKACSEVETHNDSLAFNPIERAAGIVQIRQIKLNWYFNETGIRYELKDCFNVSVSKEIFMYHMSRYSDMETGIKKWNGSGKKTIEYLKKVKSNLK